MKLNSYLLLLLFIFSFDLSAQKYLFPVKPGQRNLLAGNFSEIRPNHFHAGIDVKIGGVDGEPIRSIEDGYVYRIKVSTYGYGNVMYLKHPNGQSSVYAHLRNFSPKITEYMRQKMYEAQENELELFLDEKTLPVKRGEIIGNGGNTGSSAGPHLHFEIRDSLDRAIDPFSFGFHEVVDRTAPVLYRMALKPLDFESRVNGRFERQEFTPVLVGNRYVLKEPVKITGKVGIEVYAVDRMDDVHNVFGVPVYELLNGNRLLFGINVDHVDFNTGRFLLTHTHHNRFIRLYAYPNNPLQIYRQDSLSAGTITADIGEQKSLRVRMQDFFGNARELSFEVEGEEPPFQITGRKINANSATQISYDRNVMVIKTGKSEMGEMAKVKVNGFEMEIEPAYIQNGQRTYLWDLNYGIPEAIDLCTDIVYPDVIAKIPFGKEISFSNQDVEVNYLENTLLDDLFLRIEKKIQGAFKFLKINSAFDYLQGNVEIIWKNTGFTGDKNHTHVYLQTVNGRKTFIGGEWDSDHIRFKTRNFGTFVLEEDKISPTINPIRVNASELRFIIKDDKSGIKDFEAFVDGKWVLMRYEHKQNVIWSEKLDKQPFKGEVLLKVRDMAGNESQYVTNIK